MTNKFRQAVIDAQWSGSRAYGETYSCPWCEKPEDGPHAPDCIVLEALAEPSEPAAYAMGIVEVQRVVKDAAESEREACAQVAEVEAKALGIRSAVSSIIANAIRARGGK